MKMAEWLINKAEAKAIMNGASVLVGKLNDVEIWVKIGDKDA